MPDPIQNQIESLQRQINALVKSAQVDFACGLKRHAEARALLSIVCDLAIREGLSLDHVLKVMNLRRDWYYQRGLENTEDVSSSLAVQSEKLLPSKADPAAEFPPLFPEE